LERARVPLEGGKDIPKKKLSIQRKAAKRGEVGWEKGPGWKREGL